MEKAEHKNQDKNTTRKSPKNNVNNNELFTVDAIINDTRIAEEFFFDKMLPKMKALADHYNRSLNLDITTTDVCCATYLACWEDNWAKLRVFKGESSLFSWVAMIASQATYQFLVKEKYIDRISGSKVNDYRLTVRSIKDDDTRKAIVDMVFIEDQHRALEMFYVEKLHMKDLAKVFGSAEKAKRLLKEAEKTLICQLLNSDNQYAVIALSQKRPINTEVQLQDWHDKIDQEDVCENLQSFREFLVGLFGNKDWDSNMQTLVNYIISGLGWNEVQKTVWKERFFNKTPSKELAEQFGVRNTWIDNTYSRLNKQFRIALKKWWDKYNR